MEEKTENEWNVSPVEEADGLFDKIRATNQEGLPERPVQLVAVALVCRGQVGGGDQGLGKTLVLPILQAPAAEHFYMVLSKT